MNTKIESSQPNPGSPDHPRTNALLMVLKRIAGVTLAIIGIGFILSLESWFIKHIDMPGLRSDMSYGLLFLVGFLTGFHCVGMCGPLILSYVAKNATKGYQTYSAHFLYGIGKTLSYTLIGALLGAFGSVFAFTPYAQGAVGVAAGIFLILFGLHMLGVFPALSHFQIRTPAFVMRFVGKEYRKRSNPFVIGLLNGLMVICGPLQAMYIMAAGTGSWTQGAAIMFFFGIGTLPLLLSFGFLTSLISANLTPKILKASGFIVIILGVIMLNRGLAVTGTGIDFNTLVVSVSQKLSPMVTEPPATDAEQIIYMEVFISGYSPNKFNLRKGIPVKWIINVKELTECNKVILVPQYGLTIKLQPGMQVFEFTPTETGEVVVPWSCWMGMLHGTFITAENVTAPRKTEAPATEPSAEHKYPVIEAYWQRFVHEVKQLWQRLESLYQDVLGGK